MRTSKHKNSATSLKNLRRQSALSILEKQKESGKKPEKVDGKTTKNLINLTETDIKRIDKDIEILKTRIK